jgi:hypothetical protein
MVDWHEDGATAESRLRALAERLLEGPILRSDWTGSARLLVETLPPDLPLTLPIPPGSHVLGALVRPEATHAPDDDVTFAIVALDTPLDVDTAVAFYLEQFTALGLRAVGHVYGGGPSMPDNGGLPQQRVEREEVGQPTEFRLDADNVHVRLDADERDAGGARIQLGFSRDVSHRVEDEQSWHERTPIDFDSLGRDLFPLVEPPSGATQRRDGMTRSGDSGSTKTWLETDFSLTALADHYGNQLRDAGWIRTVDQREEQIAWSRWRFVRQQRQMRGVFTISREPWTLRGYRLNLALAPIAGGPFADHPLVVATRDATFGTVLLDAEPPELEEEGMGLVDG